MSKKVNLVVEGVAKMIDAATGQVMHELPLGGSYFDVSLKDAVDVQDSLVQAIGEHAQRMLAKGRVHAASK